jgi:hypothetical protein
MTSPDIPYRLPSSSPTNPSKSDSPTRSIARDTSQINKMSFRLFTYQPTTLLRLGLGVGIGLSAATMHPLSPFRAAPMKCEYAVPQQTGFHKDSGWVVNPAESMGQKQSPKRNGLLNAETMRQISLGSVLGLVAGVGLRAFSKALVVILGMGVVLIEVCISYFPFPLRWICFAIRRYGLWRVILV